MKKKNKYSFFSLCAVACVIGAAAVLSTIASDFDRRQKTTDKPVPRVVWTDCHTLLFSERHTDCGRYYPAGDRGRFFLPFAIFRYSDTLTKPVPLVYIAGGPGDGMQTHVDALQAWAYWLEDKGLERDLLVFDQRGLKPGEPYWDCETYNRSGAEVLTRDFTVEQEYRATWDVLNQCFQAYDAWLRSARVGVKEGIRSFSTPKAAADLNQMLGLLGYETWHLWGVSYGSRLALVTAQQQPEKVQSLLLDSPYPLDKGGIVDRPALYARALERFWRLCTSNTEFCGHDVADPQALFWRVLGQLNAEPVRYRVRTPDSSVGTDMILNGQRLFSLALFALYDQRFYPELLKALVALDTSTTSAASGELEPVRLLLNSFVASAFDSSFNTMVFYAIECNDNPLQPEEHYRSALDQYPRLRELLSLDAVYNPCKSTLFEKKGTLDREPAPDVPALVLAGEFDPVTPVVWAESLVAHLPQAELAVAPQIGHAVLGSGVCRPAFFNDFLSAPEQGGAAVKRHCF